MSQSMGAEFRSVAHRLEDNLPRLLGSNLVGIYVYGSVVGPSFVPGRSDLDCIVVTEDALDADAFDHLNAWLKDAAGEDPDFLRVQMSLLVKGRVLEDDPMGCLYQFGALSRSGSDGNPIIWLDLFKRGVVLHGPDPHDFVPQITPALLHHALVREVGYLREEISTKPESEWRDRGSYRAYAVLTLCRILYSNATGDVESKTGAATWLIDRTPGALEIHQLIQVAEGVRNESFIALVPLPHIERFISYVEQELASHGGE